MIQKKSKQMMVALIILLGLIGLIGLSYYLRSQDRCYRPSVPASWVTPVAGQSFSDYLQQTRVVLYQARANALANQSSVVFEENAPSMWLPSTATCPRSSDGRYPRGVLLIHGLLASPYYMHTLANYFKSHCFVVYTLLLPGHGTVPGDLTQVKAEDWLKTTDFALNALSQQVDQVYLAGHSLGASLALLSALRYPTRVSSLILVAPALKLATHFTAFIKPWYVVSRIFPAAEWVVKAEEDVPVKYNSFPINAIYQTQVIMTQLTRLLSQQPVKFPIFLIGSAEDATIDATANWQFFMSLHNPRSRLLWFAAQPPKVNDPRVRVVPSAILEQGILSQSHVSLLFPESDPYFGWDGSAKDCLHYRPHSAAWQDCETGRHIERGEITPANLKRGVIRRITFNPSLSIVWEELTEFLSSQSAG